MDAPQNLPGAPHQLPGWPVFSTWKNHWHLREDIVFLNHGSFGASPKVILDRQSAMRAELESEPIQYLVKRHPARLNAAREELATFLGADPANLVFVSCATAGVNAVVRSLEFQPGDEILTTSLDYNACRNVLAHVADRFGAKLVVAEIPFPLEDPGQVTAAILAAVTPRTRLAMIDHITSGTALVLPLAEIVRELEGRGVDTLVDGAHAPGMLPLDLENLGATYYTGNLHKWACAPKGAAFLWVRPDRQDALHPVVISHGHNSARSDRSVFHNRFDWPATHDPTPWFCAVESILWLGGFLPGGWDELRENHHAKVIAARRMLCDRLGLVAPCPESMVGSMATLPMPGPLADPGHSTGPDPVYQELLESHHIELQVPREMGRRWFRISAHLHNSPDEYRYLADVLEKLALS